MSRTRTWLSSSRGGWAGASTSSVSAASSVRRLASARSSTRWSYAARSKSVRRPESERALLPEEQLPIRVSGQEVLVDFLAADDQPWLRSLLEEFHRYSGRSE